MVSKGPKGRQPDLESDESLEEAIRYKENHGQGCAPFMAMFYRQVHDLLGWVGLRGSTLEENIQSFFGVNPKLLNDGTEQLEADRREIEEKREARLRREQERKAALLRKIKEDEKLRRAARDKGKKFYEDSAGIRKPVGAETREQRAVSIMDLDKGTPFGHGFKADPTVVGSGQRDKDIFGERKDPREVFKNEESSAASVDYVGPPTSDQNEAVTPLEKEKVYPGFNVFYKDSEHLNRVMQELGVDDENKVPEHLKRGFYVQTEFLDEEGNLGEDALESKKGKIKDAAENLGLMDRLTSNDLFENDLIKSLRVELKVFEYLCLKLFKAKGIKGLDRRFKYKIDEFIQSVYQLISIVQSDSLCATNFQLYSVFESFILTLIEFKEDTLPKVANELPAELVSMLNSQVIMGLIAKRKEIRRHVANDIELVGLLSEVDEMGTRLKVHSVQNMELYRAQQKGGYTEIQATIPRFSFEVPNKNDRPDIVVLPGQSRDENQDTVHFDDRKLKASFVEDTRVTIRFQADNGDPSIEFTEVPEGKTRASAIYISPAMVQQTGIAMPVLDFDPKALAQFQIKPPEPEELSIPGADVVGSDDWDLEIDES